MLQAMRGREQDDVLTPSLEKVIKGRKGEKLLLDMP